MRISYSALETFNQCPQKFKFQVIDKIKAPSGPEAIFGSSVHSALKFMFSKDPLFPTADEIVVHFEETWQHASKKNENITDQMIKTYSASGAVLLRNFYKQNPPWNFPVVDTESRFEVPLVDPTTNESHTLAGIIDRIDKIKDGEYEIIDYKTSRRLPSQEQVDTNLQMSLYHMALMKKWPHIDPTRIRLSLYFIKHNEKLSAFRNKEDLARTRENVLATIREINENTSSSTFQPKTSKLCDYCPYKPICPAWKHWYKKDKTESPSEEEMNQTVKEYFALKEADNKNQKKIKDLQNKIKEYMNASNTDRVFDARGYYVSRTLQERFQYNLPEIEKIFIENGKTEVWSQLLSADEKKLKKILSSLDPEMRDKIEKQKEKTKEFYTITTSTKPIKK